MLEKTQITAMKKADYFIAEVYTARDGERVNQIRVGSDYNYKEPWKNWEVTAPITSTFDLYLRSTPFEKKPGQHPDSCCLHTGLYWGSSNRNHMHTFINFLKPGDEINLHWQFSAGNGYLEGSLSTTDVCNGAKMYQYEVYATVTRNHKEYTFFLESAVGPMNSASMIRL